MKRISALFLSVIMLVAALITPMVFNNVVSAENVIPNSYSFSFKEGDLYDYTAATQSSGSVGYLTFSPDNGGEALTIAPLHAPTQYESNWSVPTANYEQVNVKGVKTDSLKVFANNETYLVPIKSDGKPFELKPDTEYTVTISFLHTANTQSDTSKCRGFYASSGLVAPFNVAANKRDKVALEAFGEGSYLSRPFASSNMYDFSTLPADTSALITKTVTLKTPAAEGEGYTYDSQNNAYKVNVNGTDYTLYNYFFLYFETSAKPTVNVTALNITENIPVDETGYTFSFEKEKVYDYIRAKQNDNSTGYLTYIPKNGNSGVKIAPLHAPSQYENNWSDPVAQYEEILADGKKTDSLKVYANNETYLVPIKEDGKPFELKPDKEYVINISYVHSKSEQNDTAKVRGFYAAGGYLAPFNTVANHKDSVPLTAFGENSYLSRPFAGESIDDLTSVPSDPGAVITKTVRLKTAPAQGEGYTYDEKQNAYTVKAGEEEYVLYNIFYLYFETSAKPTINITELSINEYVESDEVSVTFVNTLTNEETVVTGKKGEPFTYPEDPIDEERKFGGWYYTREYTEPFIVTVFPEHSVKVFSRFIDPPPSAKEDFESYKSNEYTVTENADGNKTKSNRLYFGDMMSLSDEAYSGEYSLKYEWDSTSVIDPDKAGSYDAATRYSSVDAKALLEKVKIADTTDYLVTFKYKSDKADTEIHVSAASAQPENMWGDQNYYKTSQPGSHFVVPTFNADGKWHTGEFVVTTKFTGKGTSLFLIINLPKNADAVLYIDDVEFTPLKDGESYIKYDSIVTSEIFVGKIGEALPEYTPVNGKHTFLGWYNDSSYNEKFNKTVFEEQAIIAYASWNKLPITFENDFNGKLSTDCLIVENKDGVGQDDDYALKFSYNGDKVYNITDEGTIYYKDRYYAPDNNALIKEGLLNDTVYVITYDIKVSSANLNVNAIFANASPDSIWSGMTQHQTTAVTLGSKDIGKGWVRKTVALKTGTLSYANCLYLYFTLENNLDGRKAEILVDNVLIEELYDTAVVFNPSNGSGSIVVKGNAGDKITAPANPEKFAYEFNGWYLDKETTLKFEQTVLEENQVFFLYPLYTDAKSITFDYENYYVPYTDKNKGMYQRHDCEVVKKPFAYSGQYVMKADRSYVNNPEFNSGGAGHLVANGTIYKRFDNTKNYIITFKYYIEKHGQSPLRISARAAAQNNFWAQYLVSNYYYVNLDEQTGKWHTGTLVVNGSLIEKTGMNYLFLAWVAGNEGMYYVDDVTVTELPEGNMAYFVDNGGCTDIPEYVTGKHGQNFKSQLPQNPKYDNHNFLGYFVMGDDGKYQKLDNYTLSKDKTVEIVARFIRIKTVQDFEETYNAAVEAMPGYNIKDYDYEVYDSVKEGNSKDNVISGTHSLHRKGKTQYFENALLLTQSQQLVAGNKYTVTFKVKLNSYLQTDGAVKLVSNNSPYFAWATYGDYFPVVAISDLTDGTWHEVSYTFMAIEPYISVQTPGYVDLYIDDVVFEYVSDDTPVSKPVQFTEYVPMLRDLATGEIIDIDNEVLSVDVDSIIDNSIGKGIFNPWFIIIPAVVIISAVAVILIIALKKKKKA